MKPLASLVIAVATVAVLAACGPSADTKGKDKSVAKVAPKAADAPAVPNVNTSAARPAQGKVHTVVGVVKEIDMAEGVVVLAHEPVESMGWAAKTRSFSVKGAVISKLQTGQKVEFEFIQRDGEYAVTALK
jgi:Cu/Ag efflux protein CusF